ncbi:MAG: hypothetical protein RL490_253, partial [Pseudomonadota bacterium]
SDFGPLLATSARLLTALFGLAVTVRPGRRETGGEGPLRVDAALAGLLATVQLGGDPARPSPAVAARAIARQTGQIIAALDAAAAAAWPPECLMPEFDVELNCAVPGAPVTGLARILAPPRPPRAVPPPIAALHGEVLALPMRVRVELAADMIGIAGLLPLRPGAVLPIVANADMPLILGQHRIGQARLTAQPDGRQRAEILSIAVEPQGGRP